MRIIGGQFRGRSIVAPEGGGTRPTSDRARQSVFNILEHAEWAPPLDGARVIDMFAGSGALGVEAISRGATFCLFVETDAGARGAIRRNVESLSLFGITRVHRRSALDLGPKPAGLGGPFTLAFLDPPYGQDMVPPALEQLAKGDWLAPGALVVAETAADEELALPVGFEQLDHRTYGAAAIWFLRRLDAA